MSSTQSETTSGRAEKRGASPHRALPSRLLASLILAAALSTAAGAATLAPPMLDITRQCDANTRHNVTAMSECVVAESEARAELLQKWSRLSDASVGKCIKIGKKARRLPYTAMAKCLSTEPVDVRAPVAPTPAGPPPDSAPASKWPYFSIPHIPVP